MKITRIYHNYYIAEYKHMKAYGRTHIEAITWLLWGIKREHAQRPKGEKVSIFERMLRRYCGQ